MPVPLPHPLQRLRRPRPRIEHVSPVEFPCLLVDDDGWVMPCADDRELQGLTEPDFIDDIVAAFDASATPLELHLVGDGQVIGLRPAGEPRPDELAAHVRAYFHRWTDQQAPAAAQPAGTNIAVIAAAISTTPVRRRRRP